MTDSTTSTEDTTPEIKYVGDYSGFIFEIDGLIYEVCMNGAGFFLTKENPGCANDVIGEYRNPKAWEKFLLAHPELAGMVKDVVLRKMNETINFIGEAQAEWGIQEIPISTASSTEPDIMFGGMYR